MIRARFFPAEMREKRTLMLRKKKLMRMRKMSRRRRSRVKRS
jgi:hypothetical protein